MTILSLIGFMSKPEVRAISLETEEFCRPPATRVVYRAFSLRHNNYVTFPAGVQVCVEFKSMNMEKLSAYAQNLPQEAKQRYSEKISIIENIDPFNLFREPVSSVLPVHQCNLPLVDASDLVSYLVLQTSYVTLKQFKSHRSLESYNQFVNGWVKDVKGWKIADRVVVTGRVSSLNLWAVLA